MYSHNNEQQMSHRFGAKPHCSQLYMSMIGLVIISCYLNCHVHSGLSLARLL